MSRALTLIALTAVVPLAGPAGAQVATQKPLSLAAARTVVNAATAEARRLAVGGAIAVVDGGGHLVVLERLDGTFPAAATVATKRARTAATFRRATREFENAISKGRTSLLGVSVMTPLQGGVPILVDGEVVGAVRVSGALSAQQDDDIASVAALALGGGGQTAAR